MLNEQWRSRLALGTVQLGMPYGIANTNGKPDQAEATAIVRAALAGGIRFFDTAKTYGDSETVLGNALCRAPENNNTRIITKLSPSGNSGPLEQVRQSLAALRRSTVYGCLLHREEQLAELDGRFQEEISVCLDTGLVEKFGVSVYSPDVALKALEHPLISIVQVPTSIFDRRFDDAGVFDAARLTGKEIHIRSVLLQGVLCMEPEALSDCLQPLSPAVRQWRALCGQYDLAPASTALAWVLHKYPGAIVLFGAETSDQVRENLIHTQKIFLSPPSGLWERIAAIIADQAPEVLNPSLWK